MSGMNTNKKKKYSDVDSIKKKKLPCFFVFSLILSIGCDQSNCSNNFSNLFHNRNKSFKTLAWKSD